MKLAISINFSNIHILNPAIPFLGRIAMLVSAFLCAHHWPKQIACNGTLGWSGIVSTFAMEKLSLERLSDLNKVAQLIRGKARIQPSKSWKLLVTSLLSLWGI